MFYASVDILLHFLHLQLLTGDILVEALKDDTICNVVQLQVMSTLTTQAASCNLWFVVLLTFIFWIKFWLEHVRLDFRCRHAQKLSVSPKFLLCLQAVAS